VLFRSVLKVSQQQFGETLKVFSKPASDETGNNSQLRRQAQNNPAFGNRQPLGGNDLPAFGGGSGARANRFDTQASSSASMEKPVSKDDVDRQTMPQTKGELIADLKRRGIDPEELKELVVSKGEVTEEEFDQLMDFPEDFLTQLDDWLQSDLLGQDILALTTQSAALQQFALLGRTSAGGRAGSDMQNILTLSDTQPKKEQMSDIIGRLLNEKGGEEGLEEGLSKDKLFEQMLNAKSSDASAKNGLFAGLLGDSITGNLSGLQNTGQGFAGIGVNVAGLNGTPSASGSIPQLPMLRGLPGQPGATEALSERIMMMRTKNLQVAEIKLDPQELGALEVRVKIVNDVASVQFHSPNPGVREALESQIVKLREMMDGAGLSLGDVGVSDQSLSDVPEEAFAGQSSEGGSSGVDSDNGDVESIDGATVMAHAKQSIGLVDYFA
jgi:hypothetical protein